MPRYTRKQMAEELVFRLGGCHRCDQPQGRALQLAALLIPEVSALLKKAQVEHGAERLRIEQEAYRLQSEPEPPFTKR